jgi:IS1 family transposase
MVGISSTFYELYFSITKIWGLEGGWKEIEKVHEMFCKRIFGLPNTTVNGACVRELGRTNRKERVVERIVKYWKRSMGHV